MKYALMTIFTLFIAGAVMAQDQKDKMTRDDKNEKNQARQDRITLKNDYIIFHRLIAASKEYNDEKRKIPKLQASNKMPVKVVITIDSLDEGDTTTKTMTGYIVQNIGDNATLMYEITYNRAEKKIVTFQRSAEAQEADNADKEEKEEKAKIKKPGTTPVVHKKKSDDDDDDDEPEEKPVKSKDKDDD